MSRIRARRVRGLSKSLFVPGSQAARNTLIDVIFRLHPSADVNRAMLLNPTFDNVRWGFTEANPEPRWVLIDP